MTRSISKYLFAFIHLFLIVAIGCLAADYVKKRMTPDLFQLPGQPIKSVDVKQTRQLPAPSFFVKQTGMIVQRNLFDVAVEEKKPDFQKTDPELEKFEKTTLNLVLWGTVTGGEDVYAIIEDKNEHRQNLYQEEDVVQGATIKKIYRTQVVIDFQGKNQILEMESDSKNPGMLNSGIKTAREAERPENIPGAVKISGNQKSNDSVSLNRQIKFRVHFSGGNSDGLMIYGIRPNAVFHQIGLRNGDIIKEIDGSPVTEQADAQAFFEQVNDIDSATMLLMRRGKILELNYIFDGEKYTVSTTAGDQEKGDQQ